MPDISAFPRDASRGAHDVTARDTYKTRDVFIRARSAGLGWGVHDVQGYAVTMPPRPTIEVGGGSTVAVEGTSSFAFVPASSITGTAQVGGAISVGFALSGLVRGGGRIVLPTTTTFAPSGTVTGTAQVTAATSVQFSPAGQIVGSASVAGASGVAFAPDANVGLLVGVSGASAFAFSLSMTPTPTARVQGASSLAFAGTMAVTASAAVIGVAVLEFQLYALLSDNGSTILYNLWRGDRGADLSVGDQSRPVLFRGDSPAATVIQDQAPILRILGAKVRAVEWYGTPEP